MDNNQPNNQTNMNTSFDFINKTYDNLSYFDLYGNSVFLFILMTLFVFFIFSYCKVMETKEIIAKDWDNQRCKPQNIPFAGFITHPDGTTAFQYTSNNFQYCVQNILTNVASQALKPLHFMFETMTKVFGQMVDSVQKTREASNVLRNGVKHFTEDMLERILNITIPLQQVMTTLMDTFRKIQAVMTSTLYTVFGSYYVLQSLMGAIIELTIKLLTALVVIIIGLWVTPFTFPAAASMTAVFLSISIPLGIIIYFMSEVLHIKSSKIPKLRCFDEHVPICVENGSFIYIKDVEVGTKLVDGSYVTAKMKVSTYGLRMFQLNNIIVSESHLVKYGPYWIRVKYHPDAFEIKYNKPYLYCLNTSNKIIQIGNIIFSDWDEIIGKKWNIMKQKTKNTHINKLEHIHEYLDDGFEENLLVYIDEPIPINKIPIKEVKIGTKLMNGTTVYGVVEVETSKLRKYAGQINRPTKLYHLLTNNGEISISENNIPDYNYIIDNFII